MKIFLLIAIITITSAPVMSQNESVTIGSIDFYGTDGVDVNRIRAALPIHEGDQLTRASRDATVRRIREAIKEVTGREPGDIATPCCDGQGKLTIYIGLGAASVRQTLYNPPPRGSARLTPAALKLQKEADEAWFNAVNKGITLEDDSHGYALSVDPEARARQLALQAYVERHAVMVSRVLTSSRDVEQRQIAAEMLGYANRSRAQIRALIHASRDVDEGVRNNAIRALTVLARSGREAALIPGECFVDLLNSLVWTDRNKSAALLDALSAGRDPRLLACLREQALTSLIEMARWSFSGHAYSSLMILGRIAGIDEEALSALVAKRDVQRILTDLANRKNTDKTIRCVRSCT